MSLRPNDVQSDGSSSISATGATSSIISFPTLPSPAAVTSSNVIATRWYSSIPSGLPLLTSFSKEGCDDYWTTTDGENTMYSSYVESNIRWTRCQPYGGRPTFSPGMCYAEHTIVSIAKLLPVWASGKSVAASDVVWEAICCKRLVSFSSRSVRNHPSDVSTVACNIR